MNYISQRRFDLLRDLKKNNIDTFLVMEAVNVRYLTGFTGDSTFLAVTPKNLVLITDGRYADQIREECQEVEIHVRPHDKTTYQAAVEFLTKAGARTVGVEANRITVSDLEMLRGLTTRLNFVPLTNVIEALRVIKDPSEVEAIRNAVRVAERAYRTRFIPSCSRSAGGRRRSLRPLGESMTTRISNT